MGVEISVPNGAYASTDVGTGVANGSMVNPGATTGPAALHSSAAVQCDIGIQELESKLQACCTENQELCDQLEKMQLAELDPLKRASE
jgi:hypothetical protein